MRVEGTRRYEAPRDRVWEVLNDPAEMAGLMPGVESFEIVDDTHWKAKVKVPLGLGSMKMSIDFEQTESRPPEHASLNAKGKGVGAIMSMETQFDLTEDGGATDMRWQADVRILGQVASMGQRVVQPIVNQQVEQVLNALDARVAAKGGAAGAAPEAGSSGAEAGIHPGSPETYSDDPEGADALRVVLAGLDAMGQPFRIGVMQLTMEPLEEMLETAQVMDRVGMDTIWLAEAYPWWRKHGMEARSSTVVSALIAERTERIAVGWGIISPFTRHPVQAAMDARVVQEAAGPGRFLLGFGTSKIFLNNARMQTKKTLGPMRDAVAIVRGVLEGGAFEYEGETWSASVPALAEDAETPREVPPVYVAATAPKMQALAGEIGDGCLTPSITTPAFVRYTRDNVQADIDIGCTIVASIHESDRDAGRDGAREIAAMYLANKFQNIKGSADTLLELAEIEMDELAPVAEAMERGGRLAAKQKVTDALLDRCKPIAGTPDECIAAIEEYREAGCTHVMLELWGEDRHRQLELFGEHVLPRVR